MQTAISFDTQDRLSLTPFSCAPAALHVLVVEDDRDLEPPLRRALGELDPRIRVHWFDKATDVYWEICRHPYDLVISDIRLPGGASGLRLWSLCRIFHPRLPFLLMSATRAERCLDLLGEARAPFLPKPFSLDSFKQCVARVLANRASGCADGRKE